MTFLQSEKHRFAIGNCSAFQSQVINFVNAQYMNWLQHRNCLICHAAGLVRRNTGLAIAGFSGGGKSTLMLSLLESPDVAYMTNDRLFVRRASDTVEAIGIPKLPRVNPGTIVNSNRLKRLIPESERTRLLELPIDDLWELERKFDVSIEDFYGNGRIQPHALLAAFVVLSWHRNALEPFAARRVSLEDRAELLGAIMKSPGPFYHYPDGRFFPDSAELEEGTYLQALHDVPIVEMSGRVDFAAANEVCLRVLREGPSPL